MRELKWTDDTQVTVSFAEADNSPVAWIGLQSDSMEAEVVARLDKKLASELLVSLVRWLARATPEPKEDGRG